jgi:hypothetical protein
LIRRFGRSVAREPLLAAFARQREGVALGGAEIAEQAPDRPVDIEIDMHPFLVDQTRARAQAQHLTAANRATATSIDGKVFSPVASTSLLPEGKSIAQSFMAAANDLVSRNGPRPAALVRLASGAREEKWSVVTAAT